MAEKKKNAQKETRNIVIILLIGVIVLAGSYLIYLTVKPGESLPEQDDYFEIYTAADYENFWNMVREKPDKINGRLMADIYLNDLDNYDNWSSQPPENRLDEIDYFYGRFDGNGHTIYGLYSENGYGMIKRNRGEIYNVTIKKSLVVGDRYVAGICHYNDSVISKCLFLGETKSNRVNADVRCKMAGISVINCGRIEGCGYDGNMSVRIIWKRKGMRAGICTRNEGEIEDCYNLVSEAEDDGGICYAISDTGEKNCYMVKNSGWQASEDGQIIELDDDQCLWIRAYLDKDLYTLYQNQKDTEDLSWQSGKRQDKSASGLSDMESNVPVSGQGSLAENRWQEEAIIKKALQDELLCGFVFEAFLHQNMDFSDLTIKGMETEGDGQLFDVRAGFNGEQVRFAAYELRKELNISKGAAYDYQKLWEYCSNILGEKNKDSWQHDTWQMLENQGAVQGIMVLYNTGTEKQGFFYIKDGTMYRIECDSTMESIDFSEVKNQIEELAFAAINEEETEESESPEDEIVSISFWESMLWELWEGRIPGDGFCWKDENIRDAVYSKAAALTFYDYDGRIPPREDLERVETLEIRKISEITTLEDLIYLDSLKSLAIYNAQIGNAQALGQMTQLKELYLINCGLSDISFVKNLTALTNASFYGNEIQDISALGYCTELTELSLGYCQVEDISALASAVKLQELGLQGNRISDIEALSSLKNLTGLNLMSNQVKDISPLKELKELSVLGLADNQISDISDLEGMNRLYNLSLDVNDIRDIHVLKDMTELEWLGLSNNQIEDFTPIEGLKKLFFLSVSNNPSQDIGLLMLTPDLRIGVNSDSDQTEGLKEAQKLLEKVLPGQEIVAEDFTWGDLNQDGVQDIAITGLSGQIKDESGNITDWGYRKVYVFLGTGNGIFEQAEVIDTRGPADGGIYGDPYQGIAFAEDYLLIQNYGGSNFRWSETYIYQYEDQKLTEWFESDLLNWVGNPNGYDWYLYDKRNQTQQRYAIAGEPERPMQKLLIWDDSQDGQREELEKEIDDRILMIEKEKEIELPEINEYYYEPDIDGGGYYIYEVHDGIYDTKKAPEDVLKMAKDRYLEEAYALPVTNYASEEIKGNYDLLAGVVLPEVFYLGFAEEIPCLLSYKECQVAEDGRYVHVLTLRQPTKDNDWWLENKVIYYYEDEDIFR